MGKIVWLASYPKSGNTWVRFFLYAYLRLQRGEIERIDVNAGDFHRMFTQDVSRRWVERHLRKPWAQAEYPDFCAARLPAQADIAARGPGVFFVKSHSALLHDQGFPTINPAVYAGAIYVVRNPLAVIPSLRDHYGLPSNDAAIARLGEDNFIGPRTETYATVAICSWRRNVESWTKSPMQGRLVLRYEDMLERPRETFESVVRHLRMPLDPRRLDRAIELTSFDRLKASEEEGGFQERSEVAREGFFRSGRADAWREELSRAQVRRVVRENRAVMEQFGYLDAGGQG
jgi:hypothetical protein